jgi:hypothetical protein
MTKEQQLLYERRNYSDEQHKKNYVKKITEPLILNFKITKKTFKRGFIKVQEFVSQHPGV